MRDGARLGDIGAAIQEFAEGEGCSVVRAFVGHGIGRKFHEAPQVSHFGKRGNGDRLKAGMCFTIEPMINLGGYEVEVLDDKWTVLTADGSLSAQFEHTARRHQDRLRGADAPLAQARHQRDLPEPVRWSKLPAIAGIGRSRLQRRLSSRARNALEADHAARRGVARPDRAVRLGA